MVRAPAAERGAPLSAGEADALTADYLAEAAQLGDCPMRTNRTARTLEALCG
jgi:hypothetical protein